MLYTSTCSCGAQVGHVRLATGSTAIVDPTPLDGRCAGFGEPGEIVVTESGEWVRLVVCAGGDVRGYRVHSRPGLGCRGAR